MRFRLPEWDIAMPDCLVSYWQAWNETDLAKVPSHLALAVTHEVEWNDPNDSFVGVDALIEAINVFRTKRPRFRFVIVSEIDHQHDRLRYRWDMRNRGRTLMEGLDIVTLDRDVGLIRRVDGFFGEPSPIKTEGSGVPNDFLGEHIQPTG